jgi:predicted nucleic acid-binding protein
LSFQFDDTPTLTTEPILFEIGNSLARAFRESAAEIIQALRTRENVEVIAVNESLFLESLELYRQHDDKTWGLVDCLSFVVMRKRRIREALTNDQHYEQAGFVALMRGEADANQTKGA